jgi:O-methyltransferase
LTWRTRLQLARRMRRNTVRVQTGLSYRGHLLIAAKVFSMPPSVEGVMVEAGCWKGGTTVNLSLIAQAVGRSLIVYDSFEGLPPPVEGDHWASAMAVGAYKGELEEVRANVERYGAIEVCEFRKGWFSDTMGDHTEPIVLTYVDVDFQASFHDCILGLWPHLVDRGYMFIDEYTRLDYCALFFSERYWRTYFDRPPPGVMGAGSGVGLGQVFPGPLRERRPLESTATVAWTRKDFYAEWDFEPADKPLTPLAGGGIGDRAGREGWTTTTESMKDHEHKRLGEMARDDVAIRDRIIHMVIEDALAEAERTGTLDPVIRAGLEQAIVDGAADPHIRELLLEAGVHAPSSGAPS